MKNTFKTKMALAGLLCFLSLLVGCCIHVGGCARAKYERTVQLSLPFQQGSLFEAQTHNGSITINGAEVADCNLVATITARAETEEIAKKLAEQIKITLQPSTNKLTAKIKKPTLASHQSVGVSFEVTLPNQSNVELTTHNGDVTITSLTGHINGTTHNGSVNCQDITGDMRLRTHNGKIVASYAKNASPVFNTTMVTHNGSIDFTAPPNLSAAVKLITHNGSIKTDLPITISGQIDKRKLTGTIGTGQGKLHLETHNGSIKIK